MAVYLLLLRIIGNLYLCASVEQILFDVAAVAAAAVSGRAALFKNSMNAAQFING